jgi:catechol 2,3-dioxygenase-like lactoylglutathione lyase family enzyme
MSYEGTCRGQERISGQMWIITEGADVKVSRGNDCSLCSVAPGRRHVMHEDPRLAPPRGGCHHRHSALAAERERRQTDKVIRGGNATIYVTDMDRAVGFYSNSLGLQLAFRAGDHWATIDAGDGFHLGLHPAAASSPAPGSPGGITVGLALDEPIEHVVATLRSRGVAVHGPIIDEGGLKLAFLTDPDGNQLYLAETKDYRDPDA